MSNEYTALQSIPAPGTSVFGYRRGDEVSGYVVKSWGLVVGDHVVEGDLDESAGPAQTMPRPTAADTRATWESWAIAQGMTPEQAAEASQEDLESADKPAPKKAAAKKSDA
jgi:hypothetical protein